MNKKQKKRQINEIIRKIVKEYHPKKVLLFGSFAWGKPTENSDIDLFIIKHSRRKSAERERELRSLLFGNKFPPMDLLIYTPIEVERRLALNDFFVKKIIEQGSVLYEE